MPTAPIILSITSIAERIELFLSHMDWLAAQTVRPQLTVIWLGEEQFPSARRAELAARYPLPFDVELRYRPDLGPQTKLLYALREFPADAIITGDDDIIYPPFWIEELAAAYAADPTLIHCARAHLIKPGSDGLPAPYAEWGWLAPGVQGPSQLLYPTGTCGVLYPPGALHPEVWNLELMRALCPTNDDTWFKAMALLQGTAARKLRPASLEFPHIPGSEVRMLWSVNEGRNDAQLAAVFGHYELASRLAS
ncbi:MAG: hypothetical protein AB4911_10285 [Oscillochloridaceae bacterium umkhey_bin13]